MIHILALGQRFARGLHRSVLMGRTVFRFMK
jgi:hypothetical protein